MGSKSRIIAFGCSFTFGLALDNPSLAWPAVLGKLTDKTVINNATPGSSNLEILHSILSFKFRKDDVVIVGWTYCHRDMVFNIVKANQKIGPWLDNGLYEQWADVHTNYDNSVRAGIYIHHAELYLDSLSLKHYQFWAPPKPTMLADRLIDTVIGSFSGSLPKFVNKNTLYSDILNTEDFASDGCHPGPVAHSIAAEKLYRIINGK